MNDKKVICEINWNVADVRSEFIGIYDREPTENEISCIVETLETSDILYEAMCETGWSVIREKISEFEFKENKEEVEL